MTALMWGLIMISIGALMCLGGTLKSQNALYQLLVRRSEILWGGHTYRFHQVSGVLIMLFGVAMAVGVFE